MAARSPYTSSASRRVSRTRVALILIGVAAGVLLWMLFHSARALPRAAAAVGTRCPTATAARRADAALRAAKARYAFESRGAVSYVDLKRIGHDASLLAALRTDKGVAALADANRQLVRHVVQIKVTQGSRVLVDANATSFDVAGPSMQLYSATGKSLGRLQITLQDVIGFIKLVHKLNAANVVVRSAAQTRTSLPAAAAVALPHAGCAKIGARTYAIRSFDETSFAGEVLTIWVLTPSA